MTATKLKNIHLPTKLATSIEMSFNPLRASLVKSKEIYQGPNSSNKMTFQTKAKSWSN